MLSRVVFYYHSDCCWPCQSAIARFNWCEHGTIRSTRALPGSGWTDESAAKAKQTRALLGRGWTDEVRQKKKRCIENYDDVRCACVLSVVM